MHRYYNQSRDTAFWHLEEALKLIVSADQADTQQRLRKLKRARLVTSLALEVLDNMIEITND